MIGIGLRAGMREVGVEGRWRPLGRGRVGDAVSGGRRRHEGAPEGWSAGGPSPPETGAAPLRKTRIWGKIFGGPSLNLPQTDKITSNSLSL